MATDQAETEEEGALPPGSENAGADESGARVSVGEYTWEDFKEEYYYDADGNPPREGGEVVEFDPAAYLGFDPDDARERVAAAAGTADRGRQLTDRRTVDVLSDLRPDEVASLDDVDEADVEAFDEDAFFTDVHGNTTLVNRYDLEKAVSMEKKRHFREVDRYWVNKPYAFVVIFHSVRENEKKYYMIEPYRTEVERELQEFITEKLRNAIKYSSEEVVVEGDPSERRNVIERETRRLLSRYDLYEGPVNGEQSFVDRIRSAVASLGGADEERVAGESGNDGSATPGEGAASGTGGTSAGIDVSARPEPVLLAEDRETLSQYQVEKLLYVLKRNFIGYERIDGIKHDINVEDISCDGYNSPVFVYHADYEQIISNVHHGQERLDDFVVKLAQRSGKGISKRQPQVDATLPDGSRAQLTLGREVSDHGTNYTIRQFKDVPFTPVDL
ncbi:MAG: hypothetical protein ABEJ42_10725, partial [Halobacteriaceae archaeon]